MCNAHEWRAVYEELVIIGGASVIGWECRKCKHYISAHDLTPVGLGGTMTQDARLMGAHGGYGDCSDGTPYKEQLYENGKLTITR